MAVHLVRITGSGPDRYILTSFNTLGAHPDNSIVLTGPGVTEESARITLRPDGYYGLRAADEHAVLHVNGRRIREHILRSGDDITLGATTFRFEQDEVVARAAPPTFAPRERTLGWTPAPAMDLGRLVHLHEGRFGVARQARAGLPTLTHLLARDDTRWQSLLTTDHDLRQLWRLRDGSLLAVGPRVCLARGLDGAWSVHAGAPTSFDSLWGASAAGAHGLSESALYHLDGDRWRAIGLSALGPDKDRGNGPIHWSRGTCDSRGRSFIVGSGIKHGALITGHGDTWEHAGSAGICALSDVACGADDTVFVLGFGMQGGLWAVGRTSHRADEDIDNCLQIRAKHPLPGRDGLWRSLDGYLGPVFPLLMDCYKSASTGPGARRSGIIVVANSPLHALGPDTYWAFVDAAWHAIKLPRTRSRDARRFQLTDDGRLAVTSGDEFWLSTPLIDASP